MKKISREMIPYHSIPDMLVKTFLIMGVSLRRGGLDVGSEPLKVCNERYDFGIRIC